MWVWDKKNLEQITVLEGGPIGTVRSVFVDDKYIYAGSDDPTITKWPKFPARSLFKALLPYGLVILLFVAVSIAFSLFL